jgi:hypothetical protein
LQQAATSNGRRAVFHGRSHNPIRSSDNRVTRSPNDCRVVVRRIGAGNQAAHPDPCSLRSNPEKVWRFWRRCAGPHRKFCRYSPHSRPYFASKMDRIEPSVRWGAARLGGLAMHGVMRALIARWAALIAMLGLLALVIATSRIPCVPYGLWPTLQMHCR